MPDDLTKLLRPKPAVLDTGNLRPMRIPRHKGLWASTPMEMLTNRQHDALIPSRLRLLLYLQIKSRRGGRTVTLTNAMAKEIGLDRHQKCLCLSFLKDHGYVDVKQAGLKTPTVTVHQLPVPGPPL
jgi:hypothetical protein